MIRIIQQFVRKNLEKQTCVQPSAQHVNHLSVENPFSTILSNSDRSKAKRRPVASREATRLSARALDETESSFVWIHMLRDLANLMQKNKD
jgi:hypothetical protein